MAVEAALTALGHLTRALRVAKATGAERHLVAAARGDVPLREALLDKGAVLERYRGYLEPTIEIPGTPASEGIEATPGYTISAATARSLEAAQDIVAPETPLSPQDAAIVAMAQFAYRMLPVEGQPADEGMDYRNKGPLHWGRRGKVAQIRARAGELVPQVIGGYTVNLDHDAATEFAKHQHGLDVRKGAVHGLAAAAQVGIPLALRLGGIWGTAASLVIGHYGGEAIKALFGDQIVTRGGEGYERMHGKVNIGRQLGELMQTIADFSKIVNIPGVGDVDPRSLNLQDEHAVSLFAKALMVHSPGYFMLRQRASAYELLARDAIVAQQEDEGGDLQTDAMLADMASPDNVIDTPDNE